VSPKSRDRPVGRTRFLAYLNRSSSFSSFGLLRSMVGEKTILSFSFGIRR
jgi:hypothetical protein